MQNVNLNNLINGRQPQFFFQMKDDLNILLNGTQPPKITIAILFFANNKIMYTDFQLGVWPGTGRKNVQA